jgi:antitoxin component of RelBE/YafQ-DinJ toxin-antitoxin module
MMKSEMVSIRLSPEEHAKAQAIAAHYGLNVASWVRMAIAQAAREVGVDVTKKRTR